MITEFLKRLITKKFYKEKSEIDYKLNVFYATGKITAEEFTELTICRFRRFYRRKYRSY